MKLRCLVPACGVDFTRNIGDEFEVPAKEAKRLINAGHAEPIANKKPREKATKPNAGRNKAVKKAPASGEAPAKKPGLLSRLAGKG